MDSLERFDECGYTGRIHVTDLGEIEDKPAWIFVYDLGQGFAEGGGANEVPLIFGMGLGASLGGNLTPFGASANVVAVGLLRKGGIPVSTREFLKIGAPFTLIATGAGAAFLWLIWT